MEHTTAAQVVGHLRSASYEWADHDPLRTAASVYLYVSDADALYAEWAALKHLDGRFVEPFDTAYGLREFVYIDPDGTAHRVGSPLPR